MPRSVSAPSPPLSVSSVPSVVPSVVCFFRALRVVSDAMPCRGGPACPPLLFRSPCPSMLSKSRRRKVEQAARLAMPAVTPAEEHNPGLYGSSKRQPPPRLAAWHARLRAPPEAAAARWSKPPGLPCRRSRRQSHTIPNATGVPTPSGPHDCALHLKPPRRVDAAQRLRPLSSPLRVLRVLCGLFFLCPPCRVRCGAGFLAGLGAAQVKSLNAV